MQRNAARDGGEAPVKEIALAKADGVCCFTTSGTEMTVDQVRGNHKHADRLTAEVSCRQQNRNTACRVLTVMT